MPLQKLLVCGDSPVLLRSIRQTGGKGLDVEAVPGPNTVPNIAPERASNVGLVFVLHAPPLADGVLSVLAWKRTQPGLPVVVATTDSSYSVTRSLFLSGASDVIEMPASTHQIAECLQAHLPGYRAVEQEKEMLEFTDFQAFEDSEHFDGLDVRLMGDCKISLAGQQIVLANQARHLLALLVGHSGKPLPRERLIANLWPEKRFTSPECARCSLNVELTKIRKALREVSGKKRNFVVHDGNCYHFEPNFRVRTDLDPFRLQAAALLSRFEADGAVTEAHLREFLALYPGVFMQDQPVKNNEWILGKRLEFSTLFGAVVDAFCERLYRAGQFDKALAVCLAALGRDEGLEQIHRRAMTCYDKLGQCHKAKMQLDFCKSALKGLYGTKPSPETVALFERIGAGCQDGR